MKGSCLCGAYAFEVNGDFGVMADCFCSMCRKAHGSAYATFVSCATNDFKLLQGDDVVQQYQSSDEGMRSFCKVCGSNLPIAAGEQLYIPAGLLDGDPGVRTSMHMFVGSKANWVEIHDEAPQFDTFPQ